VSRLQLRIFDGSRQLFSAPAKFLVTITDGNQTQHVRDYFDDNDISFDLPFFNNLGDLYTVIVWAKGFQQAGFSPISLSDKFARTLDIMLISRDPGFSFFNAPWMSQRRGIHLSAATSTTRRAPRATPTSSNRRRRRLPACSIWAKR
jgi:hypothetical protein